MIAPPSRPPAIALALGAIALAVVITIVGLIILGFGPFAANREPTGSPMAQPTVNATLNAAVTPPASPSQTVKSSSPGSTPSASPDASQPPATPSSASDVLVSHVPEAFRATCAPGSFDPPAVAAVLCSPDGGAIAVSYTLYADQPSMAAVYDSMVVATGIDDNSGRCYNRNESGQVVATTSRWPSENGYTIQDEPVGRYLCHDFGTIAAITWTDDRLYVLGRASSAAEVVDRLISFWIDEAGPVE